MVVVILFLRDSSMVWLYILFAGNFLFGTISATLFNFNLIFSMGLNQIKRSLLIKVFHDSENTLILQSLRIHFKTYF